MYLHMVWSTILNVKNVIDTNNAAQRYGRNQCAPLPDIEIQNDAHSIATQQLAYARILHKVLGKKSAGV